MGCEGAHEAGGPAFREVAYRLDGSRPTLANMFTFGDLLSDTIDVQVLLATCYLLLTASDSLLTASYSPTNDVLPTTDYVLTPSACRASLTRAAPS